MSWDISVFAAKLPPSPLNEMPEDWQSDIIGSAHEVRQQISACLPDVDWTDPTWGHFRGGGFSFEFNMGKKDLIEGFMIHVRGGGDAVSHLLSLSKRWNWYMLDCSQGEWFHHCHDPELGWKGFQSYRDSVIDRGTQDESNDP